MIKASKLISFAALEGMFPSCERTLFQGTPMNWEIDAVPQYRNSIEPYYSTPPMYPTVTRTVAIAPTVVSRGEARRRARIGPMIEPAARISTDEFSHRSSPGTPQLPFSSWCCECGVPGGDFSETSSSSSMRAGRDCLRRELAASMLLHGLQMLQTLQCEGWARLG